MVFSSPIFLFAFLPVTIGLTTIVPRSWRNAVLLFLSLLFYAWGEPVFVLVMIGSIAVNHRAGNLIARSADPRHRRQWLAAGILFNLFLLGFFKYAGFIVRSVDAVASLAASADPAETLPLQSIPLPIGISFFTFQAMSYLVDIYRGSVGGAGRFVDCALYISLFPQLIAGPIVRYHDIAGQIRNRIVTTADFSLGVQRFIIGLSKKALLADNAGFVADTVFSLPAASLNPSTAWLGLIAYSLQIYFDFSGYSDMAIGLGRMFGFRFLENFDYPYISRSIREFWRRWHISLSTWFRDYLYIPMGGSRGGPVRTYLNLWLVFVLCGLWHGAQWSFVVWGMLHGVFLVMERLGLGKRLEKLPRVFQHAYTVALVMFAWVFFRSPTLPEAIVFLSRLAGAGAGTPVHYQALAAFDPGRAGVLLISIPMCLPIGHRMAEWMRSRTAAESNLKLRLVTACYYTLLLAVFLLALTDVAANTYHPFIYFRF